MAGYWNLSRMQQSDLNGKPLPGALAYFFQAGTDTPMTVYQNASLGLAHANPVEADGFGRFPGVFFNDTIFLFYRQRVTDAAGSLIFDDDSVPIIGQSVGGDSPPPPIDTNGLLDTGDMLLAYTNGSRAGFVRANGRSIGSAGSGATERASSDTQSLFEHLWAKDANLALSGGRGLSAAADWGANKQLTLPDFRGRSPIGLDDMGGAAAGRLGAALVDAPYSPTTLGGSGGEDSIALALTQMPTHTHVLAAAADHRHFVSSVEDGTAEPTAGNQITVHGGVSANTNDYTLAGKSTEATLGRTSPAGGHTHVAAYAGGGAEHENMPPFMLLTIYLRL